MAIDDFREQLPEEFRNLDVTKAGMKGYDDLDSMLQMSSKLIGQGVMQALFKAEREAEGGGTEE